jgi:penicillin amidase
MRRQLFLLCVLGAFPALAEEVSLPGLRDRVEILRDRWGVPHIYASNQDDLFFAQGYMAARDRLFQIDLWRRVGTGRLAEILGPEAIERDRIARLVRYRGDWDEEWNSYAADARQIAAAFTSGINAYIGSLGGKRPLEFRVAGYDPAPWEPEDVVARVAGLQMVRNFSREVNRALAIRDVGLETANWLMPPEPFIDIRIPHGLNLSALSRNILRAYNEATAPVRFDSSQGSNNWVVHGKLTETGKPLLANDPHRPILLPSLRKTVHLVAPGWNVFGAGEPALPGIALGHNGEIAFGFTIVGMDQSDLYVEKLHPKDSTRYEYRGEWKKMEIVREQIPVRGGLGPRTLELKYTVHGPVIHEDLNRRLAYALKWVGSLPGSAGYFAALSLVRARNWSEFRQAVARYKVPSENLVYADREGNIGWIAAGLMPVRKNWSGLLPVPGHSGEYEWSGFLSVDQLPQKFNPPEGYIYTANANILPAGYPHTLSYEWAPPFRGERVREMLEEKRKFTVADFQRMQQDVVSLPARRFQQLLRQANLKPAGVEAEALKLVLDWDARLDQDSAAALIYQVWMAALARRLTPAKSPVPADTPAVLRRLERSPEAELLAATLSSAVKEIRESHGPDVSKWRWGLLHRAEFRHPLGKAEWHRGPVERPGDGYTVNSTSGPNFRQTAGASYRQIIDVSNWDNSVMTNVPGESGDPESPHYSDLIEEWSQGRYHPMLYSRQAVEAATVERIYLNPAR